MPGFDGTGPMGMGSRTGGGFGFCPPGSGPAMGPGYYGATAVRGLGRGGAPWGGGRGRGRGGGRGFGRGLGRGFGRGFGAGASGAYAPWGGYGPAAPFTPDYGAYGPQAMTPEEELEMLRAQQLALRAQADDLAARIAELQTEGQEQR